MNTKLKKDQDRDKEKAMQNHSLSVSFLSFASSLHQLSPSLAPGQAKFKRLMFFQQSIWTVTYTTLHSIHTCMHQFLWRHSYIIYIQYYKWAFDYNSTGLNAQINLPEWLSVWWSYITDHFVMCYVCGKCLWARQNNDALTFKSSPSALGEIASLHLPVNHVVDTSAHN